MSTALADPIPMAATQNRTRSIAMVFCCTVFGAAAQILFKTGLKVMPTFSVAALLVNWPLLLGLACYGGSTVLLVLALREGELSLLYPVISLTYAWVTILSFFWLGESFNIFKVAGLATIIGGVCLLGMKSKR